MKAQRCPVCDGRGLVSPGFYITREPDTNNIPQPESCRGCLGTGIVWEPEPVKIEIVAFPERKWIHSG